MFAGGNPIAALRATARLWAWNADAGVTGSSCLMIKLKLVAADLEMRAHHTGLLELGALYPVARREQVPFVWGLAKENGSANNHPSSGLSMSSFPIQRHKRKERWG